MPNKLVFIKNGGYTDPHSGRISYYYPVKLNNPDEDFELDDSIEVACVAWVSPSEKDVKLHEDTAYLIYDNQKYG